MNGTNVNLAGGNLDRADLRGLDLFGATGTPNSWDDAKFDDTVCPNGIEQDTSCW